MNIERVDRLKLKNAIPWILGISLIEDVATKLGVIVAD
jgi:hypothetical protein